MFLIIQCAWCKKDMGKKNCPNISDSDYPITHSICDECKTKVMAEIEQVDKGGAA